MQRLTPYLWGIWRSLPVQLLLLHFRKYQILLFFWLILFATVHGSFLYKLGAHMLYLYPEYLGRVDFLSCALVGIAVGIFIMSWNITTFILHSKQVEFLATTTQPFLKYSLNNSILPLVFLFFYMAHAIHFTAYEELLPTGRILLLVSGFLVGLVLTLVVAFSWFFGADRTIYRYASPGAIELIERMKQQAGVHNRQHRAGRLRVEWYLSTKWKLRQPRDTGHYPAEFIQRIFKQHHFSAMLAILLAFISLLVSGYFIDNRFFQVPAAASITVIFAILIAVAGATAYFLGQWTIPFALLLFLGLNWLYRQDILDPRNKAYGLNYDKGTPKPTYNNAALLTMSAADSIRADSLAYIQRLEYWKSRWQGPGKPVMVLTCVSGGGSRSATFVTAVMQQLDSLSSNGYFQQSVLISGASGGMMGAAWYREWKMRQLAGQSPMPNPLEAMGNDLLNPVFSSFAVRDLIAPPRRFVYEGHTYIKDRGYAFEEQLSKHTLGWLNKTIEAYKLPEDEGQVPALWLNATITSDGRALTMATRPVRFIMRPLMPGVTAPLAQPDAVCMQSLFAHSDGQHLRFLSALRMSATFPYVLPNVWLPTQPVVDVMDAGFRDNSGIESALKFIYTFEGWIKANCSKVLLVEIRDKPQGGWGSEAMEKNVLDLVTRPALLTQNNLFRFQEYQQYRHLEWLKKHMGAQLERVSFQYRPGNSAKPASLSFHLTQREKLDVAASLKEAANQRAFDRLQVLLGR